MKIGIIGDFNPAFPPHPATNEAIRHAADSLGMTAEIEWVPTDSIGPSPEERLAQFAGLWASPGSPYQSMAGALSGIRFAREQGIPLLGTCGGLQHMIVEYARNGLGIEDATHAEYDPYASTLFVTPLSCSLAGKTLPITLSPESRVAGMYGTTGVVERYYCNFGLNPAYQDQLHQHGFRIVGKDADDEARVLELPAHPFYIGTLFVPQARSIPGRPHPLIVAFLKAASASQKERHRLIDNYLNGPQVLRKAVAGMSLEQLLARPIPGKWSTLEVICHLADFEIVGADRIKRVIAENEPTLFDGDEKVFASRLAYHQRNAEEELLLIETIRKHVARILRTLKPEDFQRRGVHLGVGPMTLEGFIQVRINHIARHVPFIEEKRKVMVQQAMAQQ